MASREPIVTRSVVTDELAAFPIDPNWIIEGTPQARARRLSFPLDGTLSAMVWDCSAGRFDWHYGADEVIQILDGEVEITSSSGLTTTLRRGDVVYFPGDQIVRWYVAEHVRKITLSSTRISTFRRLAQRMPFARRVVRRIRAARARA